MDKSLKFFIDRVPTPIGEAQLISDQEGQLRMFGWNEERFRKALLLGHLDRIAIGGTAAAL